MVSAVGFDPDVAGPIACEWRDRRMIVGDGFVVCFAMLWMIQLESFWDGVVCDFVWIFGIVDVTRN